MFLSSLHSNLYHIKVLSLFVFFLLLGCGGGVTEDTASNSRPVAEAGGDVTVSTSSLVSLSATSSTDADGDPLTYQWTMIGRPAGSNATLNGSDTVNASFTADIDGVYEIQLVVSDSKLASTADSVLITSTTANIPPLANAGADQTVSTTQTVSLNGSSSSDANGHSLTYAWSFASRPNGSSATLSNASTVTPTFVADVDGNYVVQLIVNDGQLASNPDSVTIVSTTANVAPIANAGTDQSVRTTQTVSLNGSSSSDANGHSLTYAWSFASRPNCSSATLSNASTVTPTFVADVDGNYVVQLIVNDGQLASNPDSVTIVSTTANVAPIANAGIDQSVTTTQTVQLSGSSSSDANGDQLSYTWSITQQPATSTATLSATNIVNPVLVPDVDGSYTIRLIVNDGVLDSTADTMVVTASSSVTVADNFDGNGSLIGYTTNNADALPDVTRTDGRYRAHITNNDGNKTLHFNDLQGRLDAKLVQFPFDYIARNIGIGLATDSQTAPVPTATNWYVFAGVQVHVTDLNERSSSHVVVGHRGGAVFTIEGKNTIQTATGGRSTVDDEGANAAPDGRADIRIVGNSNRTLTVYWQTPNLTGNSANDNWRLYKGSGNLPGTAPSYGDSVYIGLITYIQNTAGLPFVGTCDAIEFSN